MIAVIDANIWIAAFCFGRPDSVPVRVLEFARTHHQIATANELELEITQTLIRKFDWTEKRARAAIAFILRHEIRCTLLHNVQVCRDPKDDMYLECAALTRADVLITGDKDL